MIGYKLFKLRKDGTLGSLFINTKQRIPVGVWIHAESHPTKGYKLRPFWHVIEKPIAPHLSSKNRVWRKVEIQDYQEMERPKSQGGKWLLANRMKVLP